MLPARHGHRRRSSCLLRRLVEMLALVAWACAPALAVADPDPGSREYEIKAAFLYNFTKFIEWPRQSLQDPDAPIVIGVLGDSPCEPALKQLVKDRRINGRAITIRRVESAQDAAATHLLFVGSGAEVRFERLKAALAAAPVITVGESRAFLSDGGAINFVLEGDKVRFEINIGAVDHAGVKISAQLLKLATLVHRG